MVIVFIEAPFVDFIGSLVKEGFVGLIRMRGCDCIGDQYTDQIPMYIPPIILLYPHFHLHLFQQLLVRTEGLTWTSGRIMGGQAEKR